MGMTLLLIGAGHGHLYTVSRIKQMVETGYRVVVINSSRYHYYSGMVPGMLGGMYAPEDTRFDIEKMVHRGGGEFIEDSVMKIDPERRVIYTSGGKIMEFDVLSCNTGSVIQDTIPVDSNGTVYPVKPLANLYLARVQLEQAEKESSMRVVVAGGGAAGVEIAANVYGRARELSLDARVIIVTSGALLEGFPERASRKARKWLSNHDIEVHEHTRVTGINNKNVSLEGGQDIPMDMCIMATGIVPPEIFSRSGMKTGPDGGLDVNEYLQARNYPYIFGTGDGIYFSPHPLPKAGVYAVRQGPLLYRNIMAYSRGENLETFVPQKKYLLIMNLAGYGIAIRGKLVLGGRTWFRIKDIIDRRYIRKFTIDNSNPE
ncbi:MAG: NAD(P)/FAD-dependent oxidoreductase [Spirochaetota bacterium]